MRHLPTMCISNASKTDELLKLAFCLYPLSQQLSQNQLLSVPTAHLLSVTMAPQLWNGWLYFPVRWWNWHWKQEFFPGKDLSAVHSGWKPWRSSVPCCAQVWQHRWAPVPPHWSMASTPAGISTGRSVDQAAGGHDLMAAEICST